MYATSAERAEPYTRIIRYERICASAVPSRPSTAPEPIDFHPGACAGSVASASGKSSTNAPAIETAARTGPPKLIRRPAYRFAAAYDTEATTIAAMPIVPCQPPCGCTPARMPSWSAAGPADRDERPAVRAGDLAGAGALPGAGAAHPGAGDVAGGRSVRLLFQSPDARRG